MSAHSVLFLCDYKSLYAGNFIASLTHLGDELEKTGSKAVYVFPEAAKEREWLKNLKETRIVELIPSESSAFSFVRTLIKTYRTDILHAHFGYMQEARLAALLDPNLKVVLHRHSDFSAGRRPGLSGILRNTAICLEDSLIGKRLLNINVGPGMKPGPRTVCIPNALVAERFEQNPSARDDARASLSLSGSDTLVLVFGWTPYVKGVDVASEAVGSIVESGHPEWKLGIICGREMTAEKMPGWIKAHTRFSGTEDWILYLPPTERIGDYLSACDLMLSASRSETFSYSVLEALWFGKRCVISDIPGTGWAASYPCVSVFRSGDPLSCSDALLSSAVSEKPDPERIRDRISADYALEDWTKRVLSVYDSLCE
ncbi:MAG: glycosyltransferase family 4 protein [Clostridia bacterium]|nr:glycosyltransferase family 4 protein [Clostridia bacterium]